MKHPKKLAKQHKHCQKGEKKFLTNLWPGSDWDSMLLTHSPVKISLFLFFTTCALTLYSRSRRRKKLSQRFTRPRRTSEMEGGIICACTLWTQSLIVLSTESLYTADIFFKLVRYMYTLCPKVSVRPFVRPLGNWLGRSLAQRRHCRSKLWLGWVTTRHLRTFLAEYILWNEGKWPKNYEKERRSERQSQNYENCWNGVLENFWERTRNGAHAIGKERRESGGPKIFESLTHWSQHLQAGQTRWCCTR